MIKVLKSVVLILFSNLFSISFDVQNYSATITIEENSFTQPFTGGSNYARISWLDWDEDGDSDLFILDEDLHFRYFRNDGTSSDPDFVIASNPISELNGMGWFFLGDFDGDGLINLVTQSTVEPHLSHVMYYEYNGTEFEYLSNLYQVNGNPVISPTVMKPTFTDIDSDGDLDFFTGNTTGTINYYENISLQNDIPVFEFISAFWEEILIVGPSQRRHGASAITFIDLDGDEDLDLAWGDFFQRSLYIIWNIGTPEFPDMDQNNFVFQFPENDPIYTSGQNMPSFADLDGDNDMDLFITVLGGDGPLQLNDNFLMYENIGTSTDPVYEHQTDNFLNALDVLSNVVPAFVDINNDGYLDFFVGQEYTTATNPTMGRMYYFLNDGVSHPTWTLLDSAFLGLEIGLSLAPDFIDIDNDNDYDLFIGDYNGRIRFYENQGNSLNQSYIDQGYVGGIDLSFFSVPEMCDLDGDDDYDMFIGSYSGGIYYYENTGTSESFNFNESSFDLTGLSDIKRTAPRFIDLDADSDFDLIIGTQEHGILIYWNIGNQSSYEFVKDNCLEIPYFGHNVKPAIADINGSGTLDLLTGISTGGFLHYKISRMGDVNKDENLDIFDLVLIINYILLSDLGGICTADINHDQSLDISDIIILMNQILNVL